MEKSFFLNLKISISISLTLGFCILNVSQIVYGQVHFDNSVINGSDIYEGEIKRLNPPLSPILIEFQDQPTPLSQAEATKIENRLKEINEAPKIPITNATILGPISETKIEPNVTKTSSTTESGGSSEYQAPSKPVTPTVVITENRTVPVQGLMANGVVESSLANKNDIIFYTGNTFAARSVDGGLTWSSMNPGDYFRNLQGDYFFDFEGDQDVIYDSVHDIFLWYMQGKESSRTNYENYIRLGVSADAYLWTFYSFTPGNIANEFKHHIADYPSLSLSKEYLYITTNLVGPSSRPIILRLSLDDLAKGIGPAFEYYYDPSLSRDIRTFTPVQGVPRDMDGMYWGILVGNDKIKIYEWSDSNAASSVKSYERKIPPWTPLVEGEGECPGLDGLNWCKRGQSKIRTGFITNDVLGFFWDANEGGEGTYSTYNATFEYPYINAATFNITDNMKYLGRPYLWSPTFAWQYAFTSQDSQGNVVIQAFFGGGTTFYPNPSLAVGIGNDFSGSSSPWKMVQLVNGTSGPSPSHWGDYLRVRLFNGEGPGWIGSGWVPMGDGTREFLTPYFFEFAIDNSNSTTSK